MNKRGQFFIIFAVIIGLLVLGITTLYNSFSKTEFNAQNFYDLCDNYNYEIHRISELNSQDTNFNERAAIRLFTLNFTKYQRDKGYNISLVYFYSLNNNFYLLNQFQQDIKVNGNSYPESIDIQSAGNPPFTITINDVPLNTDIYLNSHDFYYLIQLKKGEEIFSCESDK